MLTLTLNFKRNENENEKGNEIKSIVYNSNTLAISHFVLTIHSNLWIMLSLLFILPNIFGIDYLFLFPFRYPC